MVLPALAALPPAGHWLKNQATVSYLPTSAPVREMVYSNVTEMEVSAVPDFVLQGQPWFMRAPGMRTALPYVLTNTGNVGLNLQLAAANVASGCTGYTDTQDLANLRVVVDTNGNGLADPAELSQPASTVLAPAASVLVLLLGDVPLTTAPGAGACLQLLATAPASNLSKTFHSFVAVTDNPVLQLIKTGSAAQALRPGSDDSGRYTISVTNLGTRPATQIRAEDKLIKVNGADAGGLLLRDPVPAGARYRAGSLQASHPNALLLFRKKGEGELAYSTLDPGALAIEVATLYPSDLSPGASLSLSLEVSATESAASSINNQAYLHYAGATGVGSDILVAVSNPATVPVAGQHLGLAHWVVESKINAASTSSGTQASTVLDGTVTYTLGLRVRNTGDTPLFNLQLRHPLQGSALLGTYTTASVPATGQYTVVPGSLRLVNNSNSGAVVPLNNSFTGAGSQEGLLSAGLNGSALPVGAEFTLWYAVRVNVTGRPNVTVASQVSGQAAIHPSSEQADTTDLSTNGTDPDPDRDGNARNNSTPTPIVLTDVATLQDQASKLSIRKTAGTPVRRSKGIYDLTYTVEVKNNSNSVMTNLRVIDNLACSLNTQDPILNIASWSVIGAVTAKVDSAAASSGFTGGAGSTCDSAQHNSTDPTVIPLDPYTLLNQKNTLDPGASEVYTFTVRIQQTDPGERTQIINKAWFAMMESNNQINAGVLATSAASVSSLLVDPQGVVYDSITRQPVSGARVVLTRESCDGGAVPDLTADQIFNGESSSYTYNGKSMSVLTGSDGQYNFFWKVPPVNDICTYTLNVIPPSTHTASTLLPAQAGTYSGCGFVSPNETQPTGDQPTTWYSRVRSGYKPGSTPIDCPVIHNHIPLDPASRGSALLLTKQASKSQAEIGDFVDYQLKLKNLAHVTVGRISFDDILPAGFTYVPGSTLVGSTRLPDPIRRIQTQTQQGSLSFDLGAIELADQAELTLRYRLRIGVGAMSDSDAINSAAATAFATVARSASALQSNTAQARVRISGGVFSNLGFAVGKVWADCNANGIQDKDGEPGIPGVRLYLENGVSVITDQFGRWSLYGLKPVTHALRLDLTTLPAGARPVVLDNRQAQQAHSRFLDVKNGEMVRGDFAVVGCEAPELLSGIERRQAQFAQAVDKQLQALVSARLPADNRIAIVTDTRGLPASGTVAGGSAATGMATMQPEGQSLPLIVLPGGMQQGLGSGGAMTSMGVPLSTAPTAAPPGSAMGLRARSSEAGALPSGTLTQALLGPMAALSSVPLEEVIENLPAKAAFIELREGETVASDQINVRVTGPQQSSLRLLVNGQAVPESRVGKKATVPGSGLVAYEYIGVKLAQGVNTLQLQALDEFDNVRQTEQIKLRAPGGLARLQLVPEGRLSADPLRATSLKLLLTDASGVPITARTAVTLEASGAQWVTTDTNPLEPGLQIFVEGGEARVQMQPPAQQGVVHVRMSVGALRQTESLTFLPALTPMQGIGVIEGVLDLSQSGRLSLQQAQASNAFEQELTGYASTQGDARTAARAAFYFKGAIKGEYLLTAAYDSDKARRDRLFRDIRPDEFYPVYGDGSVRGFDAQSSGRLYVRIDKNRSFLLLGDFNTASSPEVRQISQYGRALQGVQQRYQTDNARVTSFYAETSATQQVEELPANGLSFYTLSGITGEIRPGSEKVELVVRDRYQPNVVRTIRPLARLVDYSFEPLTRRLYLVQPVASFDTDLNPQSLRVTYEIDQGGPTYKVMGTDVQVKVSDTVQLGAVAVRDENPQNQRELLAATALVRLGENTALSAEVAQTDTAQRGRGQAGRVALRHEAGDVRAQAQIVQTDKTFDNLSAGSGAGRTEATAAAEYALDEKNRMRLDGSLSRDNNAGSHSSERSHLGVALAHKFSEQMVGEVGIRHGNSTGSTAGGFAYSQVGSTSSTSSVANSSITTLGTMPTTQAQNLAATTTVRGRLTVRPESLPRLQAFGEVEQDVNDSSRHAVTVGGSYALTEKTRFYGQHALQSSLSQLATVNGQNLSQATVVGIDSAYTEGGRVYNEYRAPSQAAPQNATGLRQTLKLGDYWRLNGAIEHVHTVGANPVNSGTTTTQARTSATAVSVGLDWARDAWRWSSAFERRIASTSEASLYSLAGAVRLDDDLTLLGRLLSTRTDDLTNQGHNLLQRQQIGLAWRPAHADRWNVLTRYEHRLQDVGAGHGASSDAFASAMNNTSLGRTDTHIISTHANWKVARGQMLSLRQASKYTELTDVVTSASYWAHLLHARYTYDINPDWDIGLQAGHMWGKGGAHQNTLGLEVGYQMAAGLWLSAGYNFLGLRDPDLTGSLHTSRGAYLRLRWKFDEALWQFGQIAQPQPGATPSPMAGEPQR